MSKSNRPYVLLVAGVDSGGGAGITADCLTCHDLGAWPLPVVSALTAQSLKRVSAVEAVSPQMFKTTLDTVLEDFGKPQAVKVGVITSQKILEILLEALEGELRDVPVVWTSERWPYKRRYLSYSKFKYLFCYSKISK